MSLTTVKTALLAKLNDMRNLKAALAFETSNPSGNYPYATLTLREGTGEFRSTAHNLRTRGFWLRVYQERTKGGQGPEQAETIATNVMDELEQALDADTTLSGTCKFVIPAGWVAEYVDREVDTRVLTARIDAIELVASS